MNGLSVYDLGYHAFGKPTRITASAAPGQVGIINVEREAKLSGNIYDKGVLIIAGFLRRRYADLGPLTLTASLAFEQSYAGVDGDSASIAEVVALLSELSGLPADGGLAITGSINQHGDVQPVGGVDHKITGFHALCAARGLDGSQGIVMPHQNVLDLMLPQEIVDDVAAGRFHVHAVEHVTDALEIALGSPIATIDERVRARLDLVRRRAARHGRRPAAERRHRDAAVDAAARPAGALIDRLPALVASDLDGTLLRGGRHHRRPHPAGAGRRHRRRLVGDRRHRAAAAVGRGPAPRPRRRRAVRVHERRDAARPRLRRGARAPAVRRRRRGRDRRRRARGAAGRHLRGPARRAVRPRAGVGADVPARLRPGGVARRPRQRDRHEADRAPSRADAARAGGARSARSPATARR